MKTLNFTTPEQYSMLYEAIIGRPRGYNIQQARIIGKVLDKFEAMGKVAETKNGIILFEPISLPNKIELEDAEFILTCEMFREMPWIGPGVRRAVAVDDWLVETSKNG